MLLKHPIIPLLLHHHKILLRLIPLLHPLKKLLRIPKPRPQLLPQFHHPHLRHYIHRHTLRHLRHIQAMQATMELRPIETPVSRHLLPVFQVDL